ncbi:hypothetical protein KSC_088430 [Ktedonobacter sp. SOSP1-52]|nr:hypothetical protein KSC_088430 [Ktedonobacter sp. SOSP1-52]
MRANSNQESLRILADPCLVCTGKEPAARERGSWQEQQAAQCEREGREESYEFQHSLECRILSMGHIYGA